ncbi:MAG: UDP-3-O-[3-hydroxymyristoyl] N-acetylglucosamine deacetylase [Deltaproteobacteria bacterium]|nr:UDP-3-O-[3-hydroxymyristoyl] N-acetylglucosamine deacetylase [Deltaproteobacteria bacterium]
MKRLQGTVTREIQFAGVGLHSGRLVNLTILPLGPNSGIYFERTDTDAEPVLASPFSVTSTMLCTTIGEAPHSISTIEHLMAAFFGLGIDNALVRVSASEVPILDGSAAPFVDKLVEAGLQIQHVAKKIIAFPEPFVISEGEQYIKYEPLDDPSALEIECSIEFPHSVIRAQSFQMRFSREEFMRICEARTFCHIDSVKTMRAQGLALGGSLDNAVVVDDNRVLNADGLRYEDEFVRHKLLDFLGDVHLLPGVLAGKVTLHKAGHRLHAQFTRHILSQVKISVAERSRNPHSFMLQSAVG